MTEQIISREAMFNRGAEAARRGLARDEHNMNAWAPAVPDWQAGHDYVTKARAKLAPNAGGQP